MALDIVGLVCLCTCLCVHLWLQKRHVLEQAEQLEPRVSALDEDLEGDDEDEEEGW